MTAILSHACQNNMLLLSTNQPDTDNYIHGLDSHHPRPRLIVPFSPATLVPARANVNGSTTRYARLRRCGVVELFNGPSRNARISGRRKSELGRLWLHRWKDPVRTSI